MKRRNFIKLTGAGLAAPALVGLTTTGARAQQASLRLHQFQPPRATIASKVLKPWGENLAAVSDGNLSVQQFDAMALGGRPPELMDQARDGAVDISMTVVGYTPGRFPRSEVFELPFMMTDVEGTSRAYQQMVEEDFAENEFKDVKVLGAFVHGPGVIHASSPVTKLEDMNGLKLRAPTRTINNMVGNLGATPVGMPLPAIPEALSKGVIDGTVVPWEVTPALKLSELVTNHTEFSGDEALYTATVVVVMNKARYDALPAELRAVLDAESGMKLSSLAGTELDAADKPGRDIAAGKGNNIVTLDEAETARWKEAAQPVIEEWIAEMNGRDIDGQGLIDRAKALIAQNAG